MVTTTDLDQTYIFFCGVLVFFMHTGFAMLEGGGVQAKNRQAILIKNVMLVCTSALSWYALGYLIAGGVSQDSTFIGGSQGSKTTAFLVDESKQNYIVWFFQFAFAATSATIVSGAVAERIHFRAYLVYSCAITGVIYPVVAYWAWMPKGWLKTAGNHMNAHMGYVDFAGSGVVHMVGGCAGLVAAILVGPRKFLDKPDGTYMPRFEEDGTVNFPVMESSSNAFSALGTLILWVGWFGFNPGSQYGITGAQETVGLALVNTVLSPATAAVTYLVMSLFFAEPDLGGILNSTLGGLVAITAGCANVEPWAAIIIGFIAAFVYMGSSYMLKAFKIDDVIDASPVHFFCGIWGVFALGLFYSNKIETTHRAGLFYTGDMTLIGWQVVGIVAITAWTAVLTALVLLPMHFLGVLRQNEEEEKMGLDAVMASRGAVPLTSPKPLPGKKADPPPADLADGNVVVAIEDNNTEQRTCF